MQRVPRLRLPRERLQQPFAFDRHRRLPFAPKPTDRVLQQATQIRIPRAPERPVHVAREIREARAAPLPEHCRRLVSARRAGVDHLGRECRIRRDDGQRGLASFAQPHREAVLGPRQQGRAVEAGQHRMALLDPHVAVGGGAHHVGRDADTEQVGESRLAARVAPSVVARRLESGQERATRLHEGADLAARLVGEVRGVGDEQRAVAAQRPLRQITLVHEVEHTAPLQQRRVQPLQIVGALGSVGAAPEGDGALREQHREVGHRARVAEVRLVGGEPGEELAPRVPPALVLGRATQPVKPRHHAARDRLRHPQGRFGRGLRDVAPHRAAVAIGAGHVGDRASLHHRAGHATLLRAIP